MKRPFQPEMLRELRFVSDVCIAPDGERVAFVETWVEEGEQDGQRRLGYRSAIMLVERLGGPPRRLTYGGGRDTMPRWAPDGGQLAFLSNRDGTKPQLYLLDLRGGEASRLTDLSLGVLEFAWRPDGKALALSSRGHRDEQAQRRARQRDELIIERLPYKSDSQGFLPPERAQIWLLDLAAGAAPVQLTSADRDHLGLAWAPDGRALAFVSAPTPELEYLGVSDLFVLELEGGEERCLTPSVGIVKHAAWSPDGSRLALIGHDNATGMGTNEALWMVERRGGGLRKLGESFAYDLGNSIMSDSRMGLDPLPPCWDADGQIYVCASVRGRTALFSIPEQGGEMTRLTDERQPSISGFSRAHGRTALAASSPRQTESLYVREPDGRFDLLYRSNAALLDELELVDPERIAISGADGLEVEGWVLRPPGASASQPAPLVLSIHGGPHAAYGYSFFHEFQILAGAGMGVLYINPRGSTSYGGDFRALVRRNFADKDYLDLMAAVDLAQRWDWVNSARLGVMGGSYGGFMTNWITSHTSRFVTAITERSICNLASFYGTSDIGPHFSEDEFGGTPWDNMENYVRRSPLFYAHHVATPTLILHSEQDHRCPIEQGEQWFTALHRRGVPARFVRFPRDNHELNRGGEPGHRITRIGYILDWLSHYLLDQPLKTAAELRATPIPGGEE